MLHNKASRIGLLAALTGLSILGASLYTWTQTSPYNRLFYTKKRYEWVPADSSPSAAIDTDEVWHVSAECQKPYFVDAVAQARAKLQAFDASPPDEVRKWLDRPAVQQPLTPPNDKEGSLQWLLRESKEDDRARAASLYELELQNKYFDWFHAKSMLEQQLQQWKDRLQRVADRTMTLSEARRRNAEIRSYSTEDAEAADSGRDFEHFALFLLGLGGFSDKQIQGLEGNCIKVTKIKKIIAETTYHTDFARWTVDHTLSFWGGFALFFGGLLFAPALKWINGGAKAY